VRRGILLHDSQLCVSGCGNNSTLVSILQYIWFSLTPCS